MRHFNGKFFVLALFATPVLFASCKKKTFKDLALKKGLKTGIAVTAGDLYGEKEKQIVLENSAMIVSENSMKWANLRPNEKFWNWGDIDAMIKFAQENGIEVKWHTLFWHQQNSPFLGKLKTKDDALEMMDKHIKTIMERYKGKISEYDVVNEMFNEDGSMRESLWYNLIGQDYIEHALRVAHEADPNAKLYLNEYSNEEQGHPKADAMFNFVKDLKARGVPLDGIGMQLHLSTEYDYNFEKIRSNVKRYAEIGVDVCFSEVDVRMPLPSTEASLAKQMNIYTNLLKIALEEPNVKSFITWGFTDNHSWVPGTFPGTGEALLYTKSMEPKLVYEKMLEVLRK